MLNFFYLFIFNIFPIHSINLNCHRPPSPPNLLYNIPRFPHDFPQLPLAVTPRLCLPLLLKRRHLSLVCRAVDVKSVLVQKVVHKDAPPRQVVRPDEARPLLRSVIRDLSPGAPESDLIPRLLFQKLYFLPHFFAPPIQFPSKKCFSVASTLSKSASRSSASEAHLRRSRMAGLMNRS